MDKSSFSGASHWSVRLQRFGPWGLLLVAWLIKTWEIWRYLTERHYALWGFYFDTLHMCWMSWWTSYVLQHPDQTLFHSTLINYPEGASTAVDFSLAFVHVALAGLLRPVVGPLAAHNLVAILGCAITLVALYLLLRHLARSGWFAAALASLVFTFALGSSGTLPDLEVLVFGYAAFATLAWLRYVESGGWWRLALAVVALVWTGFTQMYYGLSVLSLLGMAMVLSLAGGALPDTTPRVVLRRTGAVLGIGLSLMVAVHLHNIGKSLADQPITVNQLLAQKLHTNYIMPSLLQGLAILAFLGGTIVFGIRRKIPGVAFLGLMVLPLTILSIGEIVKIPGGRILPMPLLFMRSLSPIFQRLTFSFRLVPGVLMMIAAMFALLWRYRDRLVRDRAGRWTNPRLGVMLIATFWVGAAFCPVVPRLERIPAQPGDIEAVSCMVEYPDPCTLTQRWVNLCEPRAGDGTPTPPPATALWIAGQLLRPLRPQGTVPMPEPSACVRFLVEEDDDGPVLEFSPYDQNGYRGYHQTFHERALVSFPVKAWWHPGDHSKNPFKSTPPAHSEGLTRETLPTSAALSAEGVGFVALYRGERIPRCEWGYPQRKMPMDVNSGNSLLPALAGGRSQHMETMFESVYGEPVCQDEVLVLYRIPRPGLETPSGRARILP